MSTIVGVVLGLIAVGVGMVIKGASLSSLLNPAAILIIFVGTAASLIVAFPWEEIKRFPKLLRYAFSSPKQVSKVEIIQYCVMLAGMVRREGLLSLEAEMSKAKHPFLAMGLGLVIDGTEPELARDIMLQEIEAMESRHRVNASIFSQAGTYAPTLGVLGAVVGLVAAMSNMSNMEALGQSISAAFMATMFGIFTGYVLWHPIANKLKRRSQQEAELKLLMVEGIMGLLETLNPAIMESKLAVFLPTSERELLKESPTKAGEGNSKAQKTRAS